VPENGVKKNTHILFLSLLPAGAATGIGRDL